MRPGIRCYEWRGALNAETEREPVCTRESPLGRMF